MYWYPGRSAIFAARSHVAISRAPTATDRSPCPPGFSFCMSTSRTRVGSIPSPLSSASASGAASSSRGMNRSEANPTGHSGHWTESEPGVRAAAMDRCHADERARHLGEVDLRVAHRRGHRNRHLADTRDPGRHVIADQTATAIPAEPGVGATREHPGRRVDPDRVHQREAPVPHGHPSNGMTLRTTAQTNSGIRIWQGVGPPGNRSGAPRWPPGRPIPKSRRLMITCAMAVTILVAPGAPMRGPARPRGRRSWASCR